MNGYFVTGTGTGVGKTFVVAAIARSARRIGQRVFAFKPIETGCALIDGVLIGADQTILCDATGGWQTGELRGVYQFEPPVAPFAANREIDVDLVLRVLTRGASQADLVLVEGAGGWRVPITSTIDMGGLAKRCGLPVIVVGAGTLGTINHSLLTVEAVERDGLAVAALVLSSRPEDFELAYDNACHIQSRWNGNVLVYTNNSDDLATFHVKTT